MYRLNLGRPAPMSSYLKADIGSFNRRFDESFSVLDLGRKGRRKFCTLRHKDGRRERSFL